MKYIIKCRCGQQVEIFVNENIREKLLSHIYENHGFNPYAVDKKINRSGEINRKYKGKLVKNYFTSLPEWIED